MSNPEVVLDELDTFLEKKLNIDYSNEKNFGLDCGVCCFSPELDLIRYAGARFDLLIQKYGELTGQMVGVISEIDDSEGYRLVKVTWAGERERTSHRPLDLNLVEK